MWILGIGEVSAGRRAELEMILDSPKADAGPFVGGSKDRISTKGSLSLWTGIGGMQEIMVSRILMFMWLFGALVLPRRSKYRNMKALGPNCHAYYSLWERIP